MYVAYLLATYRGLPNVLVWMALLTAIYSFVTNRTTVGRRIYALGGNEKAAALSGIPTRRLVFLTFANMGMLAAVAGTGNRRGFLGACGEGAGTAQPSAFAQNTIGFDDSSASPTSRHANAVASSGRRRYPRFPQNASSGTCPAGRAG